jgi:hypothetical protein
MLTTGLCPDALQKGLKWFKRHPECAFVSGGTGWWMRGRVALCDPIRPQVDKDHYLALLKRNYIAMHATVMYKRESPGAVQRLSTLP